MKIIDAKICRPYALGIISAISAVVLGIAYKVIAGAPTRYAGVAVGALVVGLTMLALVNHIAAAGPTPVDALTFAIGRLRTVP